MGIAGVAVFTAEFAAAVGIDGPLERHGRLGSVKDASGGDLEVLNGALGFEQVAGGSKACNAQECHATIFAFYSPFCKSAPARSKAASSSALPQSVLTNSS